MELELLHALQGLHSDILDEVVLFITSLGNSGILWIITGLLLLLVPAVGKESKEHLHSRRIMGVNVLLSLILGLIFGNILLKNIVKRPRPFQVDTSVVPLITPGEYSFPSGHTTSSFAAACSIYLHNKKAGIAAFAMAAVIAFTRLYLFVHYPTDILGGIVLGILCANGANWLLKLFQKRRENTQR